ncbi:penicillin-binding protein 2 [bacterium]|nr:MAG: penicillin-binding protein 2 [bacterium]
MFFSVGVLFLILFGNIFRLQVVKGSYYYRLSESNRIRIVPKRAARGQILDRRGRILVDNKPTYTISVLPFEFKPTQEVVARLEKLLDITKQDIEKNLKRGGIAPYSPVPIKRQVDFETVSYLEEHLLDFPGVIYEVEPVRIYPYHSHAAHTIGYIGEINIPELRALYKKGYKAGDFVGKLGVEKAFDWYLRGKDGADYLEVRVTGEVVGPVEGRPNVPAIPGAQIVTTIDLDLQAYAETLMAGIGTGVFIAMDPGNGEILAMVSRPGFDLGLFTETITDSIWQLLNDPETHPLLNRATQGTYPPASIFKLVTAHGAVDEGIANANTCLEPCRGSIWYGDRWFNCWNRRGHGNINLIQAIAQSCDVYFYQLALYLGLDKWSELAKESGFGKPTGIDITPEASGFIPDRDYYNRRYGGRRGWGAGVLLNLCIGQGEVLVTPIQLAQYICAVANGGTIYRPKVVREIRPPMDRPLVVKDEITGRIPASPEAIRIVKEGMVAAVNEPLGTGIWAYLPDIVIAGKTGTAQNPHGENHAWFVCFAPADNPKVMVLLLVEQGGSGGNWAYLPRNFIWYYFNVYEPRIS